VDFLFKNIHSKKPVMKKSKSFLALAMLSFAFVSCKKTFTCTCTNASSSYDAFKRDYKDKEEAEAFCKTYESGFTTCMIK